MFGRLSVLMVAAACFLTGTAQGAGNYERALGKAGRKPVVAFCYGANFDYVGAQAYDLYIKQRKIFPATRGAILVEVPIYQLPNEKERKEQERVMGSAKLPGGIWSFPCFAVVDANNNLRGVVQSADEIADPEKAVAALQEILKNFKAQEDILVKADKASPKRRASLLAQAADINVRMPANMHSSRSHGRVKDEVDDKVGLKDRLNFDFTKVVEKLNSMSFDHANRYIRGMMASGCYSRSQRQEMMAAYAGHLRRNHASKNRLKALYYEMRNIDPDSIYGAYAEGALELWVKDMQEQAGDAANNGPAGLDSGEDDSSPVVTGGKTALGSTEKEEEVIDEGGTPDAPEPSPEPAPEQGN